MTYGETCEEHCRRAGLAGIPIQPGRACADALSTTPETPGGIAVVKNGQTYARAGIAAAGSGSGPGRIRPGAPPLPDPRVGRSRLWLGVARLYRRNKRGARGRPLLGN